MLPGTPDLIARPPPHSTGSGDARGAELAHPCHTQRPQQRDVARASREHPAFLQRAHSCAAQDKVDGSGEHCWREMRMAERATQLGNLRRRAAGGSGRGRSAKSKAKAREQRQALRRSLTCALPPPCRCCLLLAFRIFSSHHNRLTLPDPPLTRHLHILACDCATCAQHSRSSTPLRPPPYLRTPARERHPRPCPPHSLLSRCSAQRPHPSRMKTARSSRRA